jgi:HEAT repeat protein
VFNQETRFVCLRSIVGLLPFALCPLLCGCAGFWDEVTSRDFTVQSLFVKSSPLVVLRDSKDGDKRAKAYAALREPKQNGGTPEEQEMVIQLLSTAAVSERQSLCRVAAIESLGHFKDPRAVEALKTAYERANSFPPDQANRIRCQALTALGETGNPAAVDFLVRVVQQPPIDPHKGTEQDKQHVTDERIAAARALGHFSHYQATEALLSVLQKDKDVALRDRAHESLQMATGKKLPADPKAWDEVLHREGGGKADVQQASHSLFGLF